MCNQKENQIFNQLVQSLQEAIRIPSKFSEPKPDAPRGEDVKKCIEFFVELGQKLGFEQSRAINGLLCSFEIGKGEEFFILSHADVVPEGEGWSVNPYGGEIIDGKIYGRGALDDKGPTIAVMYAVRSLIEEGKTPTKKIKFVIGGDEEGFPKVDSKFALNDLSAMDVYRNKCGKLTVGFSPDADFPVIYAEKGILHLELRCKSEEVSALCGGERANVVPNSAYAILNGQKITTSGISAHGSTPEKGENAIVKLLKTLSQNSLLAKKLYSLFEYTDGRGMDIDCFDNESGALSLNVGIAKLEKDTLCFTVDLRYPVTKNKDEILQKIKSVWKGTVKEIEHKKPLYVSKDDSLVKNLLSSYREVTKDNSEPIAIGGGTYARELEKGVAFGALFPNQENRMHMADEYVSIENLKKTFLIYKKAIEKLCF